MAQLIILYNIFILLTLFVSFNIPVFIFIKTRDKFLGHYILFFLPFILYTLSLMTYIYLLANVELMFSFRYLILLLTYLGEFFFVAMMFSIAYFNHYIFSVDYPKLKNFILLSVIIIEIILIPFQGVYRIVGEDIFFKYTIFANIPIFVFIIILLYFFINVFLYYNKIKRKEIKDIAKTLLILTAIFFPGILYDFYEKFSFVGKEFLVAKDEPVFLIHPIFYCLISIFCTYHIVRYYFKEYQINLNEIPLDTLIKNYEISSREKEVVKLLLSGRSNKEIADSLFISVNTVKTHIKNIYEKVGIKSRYELLTVVKNF